MTDHVGLARRAMSHLEKPRQDGWSRSEYEQYYATFFELVADDIEFWCPSHPDTPYFGTKIHGRRALQEAFVGDTEFLAEIAQERWPLEYYDCGNGRVIVLGSESWTIKKTGKTVGGKEYAFVLDFRDGLIARYKVIQDQTDFYLATRADYDGRPAHQGSPSAVS